MLKIQIIFKMGRYGWQEVFWKNAAVPQALTVPPDASAVVDARRVVLCNAASVVAIRFTDDTNAQPAQLYRINRPGLGSSLNNPTLDNENAPSCFLYRFYGAAPATRRNFYLRGCPDFQMQVDATGSSVPNAAFDGLVRNFVKSLKDNAWGMRYMVTGRRGQVGRMPVVDLTVDTTSYKFVLTVTDHGLTDGSIVNVHGFRTGDLGRLNGLRRIAVIDPNKIMVPVGPGNTPASAYVTGADVSTVSYSVNIFDHNMTEFIDYTTRNTGRPFGQHRGRRKVYK